MLAPNQFDEWDTAVPDCVERIKAGKSLVPDLPLHDAYAEKALRIFKSLRYVEASGSAAGSAEVVGIGPDEGSPMVVAVFSPWLGGVPHRISVPRENRTVLVPRENRTVVLPRENRRVAAR